MFRYSRHMTGTKCSRTWLTQLRQKAGLKTADLAKMIGVSERLVRHWEAGTRSPSRRKASALANLLGAIVHKQFDLEAAAA